MYANRNHELLIIKHFQNKLYKQMTLQISINSTNAETGTFCHILSSLQPSPYLRKRVLRWLSISQDFFLCQLHILASLTTHTPVKQKLSTKTTKSSQNRKVVEKVTAKTEPDTATPRKLASDVKSDNLVKSETKKVLSK